MAKPWQTGTRALSLYEINGTLRERMEKLSLTPLTEDDESWIRGTLGIAMGQFPRDPRLDLVYKDLGLPVAEAPVWKEVERSDVETCLMAIAKHLEAVDAELKAATRASAFVTDLQMEVVPRIAEIVAECPTVSADSERGKDVSQDGLVESWLRFMGAPETEAVAQTERASRKIKASYRFLEDFRERARIVATAARVAAIILREPPESDSDHKGGHWYDGVAEIVLWLRERDGVELTQKPRAGSQVPIDARCLDIAQDVEHLLYPGMRATSAEALAQRLHRSKRRLMRKGRH